MNLENSLKLGNGIYTVPDISKILRLPGHKVHGWINKYWDGELGAEFGAKYSWSVKNTRAISFHTLIEFYVLYSLAEAGVKTRKVLTAHKELSKHFNTPFPFAKRTILEGLRTDGSKVFLNMKGDLLSLDGSRQFNLSFIEMFFKNLDFDQELLASKFWPLGRQRSIVIDPKRKFGSPLVGDHNIYPETLFSLYKGGESIEFISLIYNLDQQMIKDAIEFCQAA